MTLVDFISQDSHIVQIYLYYVDIEKPAMYFTEKLVFIQTSELFFRPFDNSYVINIWHSFHLLLWKAFEMQITIVRTYSYCLR